MPTWGEILAELQQAKQGPAGLPDFDTVRRGYLQRLHALTKRDTILYATDWFHNGGSDTAILLEDMQGMMEVCRGLAGPGLDVILHSPGGSPEAAASIVGYLRRKFTDIRVFVPLAAMSAATMWALAADRIVMGKHSQLGPIDPQLVRSNGQFPARAILDQFARAERECSADPSKLGAWLPILQQYGPSLLEECEKAEALAKRLVAAWLERYMFAGKRNRKQRAERVANYFADYTIHQSHGLGIDRDQARSVGVVVEDLEDDPALQDAVLSVHHAAMHTLAGPALKIVENHLGRGFYKVQQQIVMQAPGPVPMIPTSLAPLLMPEYGQP